MAPRSPRRTHMAPPQELAVEPITDAAEQAVLDERLRQSGEVAPSVRTPGSGRRLKKATTSEVLALTQELSAEERFRLAAQLVAQLSPDKRVKLLEKLTAQRPPDRRASAI